MNRIKKLSENCSSNWMIEDVGWAQRFIVPTLRPQSSSRSHDFQTASYTHEIHLPASDLRWRSIFLLTCHYIICTKGLQIIDILARSHGAMKKDVIYSMRISRQVREALKTAARRERRTVASLVDKVISEYLEKEGFVLLETDQRERRKFPRKQLTLPVLTTLKTESEEKTFPSILMDMSLGGVRFAYPKGSSITLSNIGELPKFILALQSSGGKQVLHLACETRRIAESGNQIHVGATFSNLNKKELDVLSSHLV